MFKVLSDQRNANQNDPEIPLTPVRMAKTKPQVITHVGEDVEKEEHSSIAGGIASWYNHYGNQFGGSSEKSTLYDQKIQQYLSWAYTQKIFQLVRSTHPPLCS